MYSVLCYLKFNIYKSQTYLLLNSGQSSIIDGTILGYPLGLSSCNALKLLRTFVCGCGVSVYCGQNFVANSPILVMVLVAVVVDDDVHSNYFVMSVRWFGSTAVFT